MSKVVILLGAGASRQAGAPLMRDFMRKIYDLSEDDRILDGEELKDFALVLKAFRELQSGQPKARGDENLESIFGAFEMAGFTGALGGLSKQELGDLPNAMRRVMAITLEKNINFPITNGKIFPPQPYSEFVSVIKNKVIPRVSTQEMERLSIVSFNYDLCLDFAFNFYGVPLDYCLEEKHTDGIKVLKMHGSVNWFYCNGCKSIQPWLLNDYFTWFNWKAVQGQQNTKLELSKHAGAFRHCDKGAATPIPALIPPTWNKAAYHNELKNVWSAAARELKDAEYIFICGYSFPYADEFFRYLYGVGTIGPALLKGIIVYDPEPTLLESRFKSLVNENISRNGNLLVHRSSFQEAVSGISEFLGKLYPLNR